MSDILEDINRYKRDEVTAAKAAVSLETIAAHAQTAPPVRPFVSALQKR